MHNVIYSAVVQATVINSLQVVLLWAFVSSY